MLTDIELPGFPPPDGRPVCVGCRALVPLGFTADNPNDYTARDLEDWLTLLPTSGAPADAVFPDPRGLRVDHRNGCVYGELPPVALWQEDKAIADQVHERLWNAKQP